MAAIVSPRSVSGSKGSESVTSDSNPRSGRRNGETTERLPRRTATLLGTGDSSSQKDDRIAVTL